MSKLQPTHSLLRAVQWVAFAVLTIGIAFACSHPTQAAAKGTKASPGASVELANAPGTVWFSLRMEQAAKVTRIEVAAAAPVAAVELHPDREGTNLGIRVADWDSASSAWKSGVTEQLVFVPKPPTAAVKPSPANAQQAASMGLPWPGRLLSGKVLIEPRQVHVWLEGRLLLSRPLPPGDSSSVRAIPGSEAVVAVHQQAPLGDSRYLTIDLAHLVGTPGQPPQQTETIVVDGVPFEVHDGGNTALSLAEACWPQWSLDPAGTHTETYDAGSAFLGDRRTPSVQVPRADYCEAYLLARCDNDPHTVNRVTMRAGSRKGGATRTSQVRVTDFTGEVPRDDAGEAGSRAATLKRVRIPWPTAFAQDIEGEVLDLEINKEVRLAVASPDPNRYRWRPLGLPSGVTIAGLTLKRSPIQMELTPIAVGGMLVAPQRAGFTAKLRNVTDQPQQYVLSLATDGPTQTLQGSISPGGSCQPQIQLPPLPLGLHKLTATLSVVAANAPPQVLLVRSTTFGTLPEDSRQYRDESPLGIGGRIAVHFNPANVDDVGQLFRTLGLRYGLRDAPYEVRQRYGLRSDEEISVRMRLGGRTVDTVIERYEQALKEHPDLLPQVLVFHEDGISPNFGCRIPDLFHDRPAYVLNAEETEQFHRMWDAAESAARQFRQKHPEVKLSLGNGGLVVRELFYRNKFPAAWFDAAGNENASFGRPPETQPPDSVANNASLWMDRQMLDAYGYGDKPVTQCHETIYPCTSPGSLRWKTQADYLVRHLLHSLAWRIRFLRATALADQGDSYYCSNWGGIGLFTARPMLAPKPAAIAIATLTQQLDGARYQDFIDTGSESAYLMRFVKKDGSLVLPFWVVRGQRQFRLTVAGASEFRSVAWTGQVATVPCNKGVLSVTACTSPGYLELPAGALIARVELGLPRYPDSDPQGEVVKLAPLDSLDGWQVEQQRSPLLELYNPITPRRKGDFRLEVVNSIEGRGPALSITPRPLAGGKPTMPMYAELVHSPGIPLPGRPTEIGLWVYGNSAWGRLIFELEDASGQRWISIGAKATRQASADWMADWLGKELVQNYTPGDIAAWNSDDAYGLSRINFDGWRYIGFPLPGQYPGEGYHWPMNSQWRSDKDGVVHYPLTLKKLIVELPEKTLYLTRYQPARRPEIYLRDLVSVTRDRDTPKTEPTDYVESVQVGLE